MSVAVSNLVKRFGVTTAADGVTFTLSEGRLLALLGPSGSGKTTVLRMLAGLERPDAGSITIHGRMVFGGARDVAAEDRDVGMVFQDYALWPHMTVDQNIAFGLGMRGLSRGERAERVQEALALVHLDGLGVRYPDQLSGGQQQRVAIARALATRPRLLLLDEPLSNLDAALREEMRVEMVRLFKAQGITAVYVTHDRIEALAMADEIVVMRDGHVEQVGTPEDLYLRPDNTFIAAFLGAANFLYGEVRTDASGMYVHGVGPFTIRGRAHGRFEGMGVALLRPEDGIVHAQAPPVITDNVLCGDVVYSEFLGGRWRHVIAIIGGQTVQVMSPGRAPGERVWVEFPAERCIVLPDPERHRV